MENAPSTAALEASGLLDSTAFLITDASRLMRRQFDSKMAELGLPRSEWYLMAYLYYFDGSTQQELADLLDVTKSGMAKQLGRLEKRGLIRRERSIHSGRSANRIVLTDKGKPLADTINEESRRAQQALIAMLSSETVAALNDALRAIRAGFPEVDGVKED